MVMAALAAYGIVSASQGAPEALPGHVPPAARREQAVGTLAATRRLHLALGLPLRQRDVLNQLLRDLYNPSSGQYHRYLTPEQFAAEFCPTLTEYAAVVAFARTNGFEITATHPNRMLLDVSASVADIEKAFHVHLRLYPHPTEARNFYAPDREPVVDSAVPLLHISGLSDFRVPRPASLHAIEAGKGSVPQPNAGSGPGNTYRGGDFRAAYANGVTLTGAGQSVGLLQFDGYYPSDITNYASRANIPFVPVVNVLLDDFDGTPGTNSAEVSLDIEMVTSMAPGLSRIISYEAGPGGNPDDILNRMATDNLAKQLSGSWSYGTDATTEQIFQEFAAQGQSYFNASGDNGAYAGAVDTPSDDPYITIVGGTTLSTSGPAGSWTAETAWNWASTRGGNGATGGGSSTTYSIPSWQQPVSMATNGGSLSKRNLPDVAMAADNIWVLYGNGQSGAFGGTSCATPLWAGLMALANQQAASAGQPSVGFINPAVYALCLGSGYSTNFHDITTGNNTNSSSPNNFFAVPGYDLCTGWGTPIGANLINSLAPRPNAPVVVAAGATLVSESCPPGNGALDPGESVTVSFGLQNVGAVPTTNLTATLQADSGVLVPSPEQAYGALAGGDPATSRAFTFTANGTCGSNLTATLLLQDGGTSLGSATFTFALGQPITVLTQNFDAVTSPALPSGWTTAVSGSGSNWFTSSLAYDSAPNAAFVGEPALPGISELTSPAVPISTASAQLIFRNYYNLESDPAIATNAFDGGVLEIQIGNGGFTDILAAGGSFAAGGYTRKIDPTDDNPLDGREVWSGLAPGFITTVVNLPASAAGQNVQFKWRLATDSGNFYGPSGWYIDNIAVQDGYTCCVNTQPVLQFQNVSPVGTNASLSVNSVAGLNYTLEYKNSLLDANWSVMGSPHPGTGGVLVLQDTNSVWVPSRFYRVIAQP